MSEPSDARRTGGRPRDRERDAEILDAALSVLSESGYDATTIDVVAARAGTVRATVYRRWPTKADLIVAAVGHLSGGDASAAALPDTGTLRGDLLASIVPMSANEQRFRIDVMSAVADAGRTEPKIAELTVSAGIEPWLESGRALLRRAIARGEYPPVEIETLVTVLPTMSLYRIAIERRPITIEFVTAIVDDVILPALRARA